MLWTLCVIIYYLYVFIVVLLNIISYICQSHMFFNVFLIELYVILYTYIVVLKNSNTYI